MRTTATERIKGYCTEVTPTQWEELVRVANENGIRKGFASKKGNLAFLHLSGNLIWLLDKAVFNQSMPREIIPFPDFLAKLRGVEEWQPKAGEMVEVSDSAMTKWFPAEYIAFSRDMHIVWCEGDDADDVLDFQNARPIRPTITRAEAEQQLGKRIID